MMNVGMRSFYPIGVFRGVRPTPYAAPRMRRIAAALPLPLALIAAAPAHAAVVSTDRGCYLETRSTNVTVNGSGFAASRPYTVALDGVPLTTSAAATNAQGEMQGTISPPTLKADEHEASHTIGVSVDGVAAASTFTVTKFLANFSPSTRIAPGSRVRFSVYGFALSSPNPDVYLHYVDPAGKLRHTVRLGAARGQCGSIARTARRKLFPFGVPRRGKWQLQFDTSKTFTQGRKGSPFLFYTIGINVRSVKRKATVRGGAGSLGITAPHLDGGPY
jgi:hypothetical protein